MDKEAFAQAVAFAKERTLFSAGIGQLREKTLHATFKFYLEPHEENHEQKIGGYIADIVGEQGVIEIQTGNTTPLIRKIKAFLPIVKVMVVCPVIRSKQLVWIDPETGEVSERRKSPKGGTVLRGLAAAAPLQEFLLQEGFTLCIPLLDCEEYRYLDGRGKDRKKGCTRADYLPTELLEEWYFSKLEDYQQFFRTYFALLPTSFTVKDFSKTTKITGRDAYHLIHLLEAISLIEQLPREGRANRYRVLPQTAEGGNN